MNTNLRRLCLLAVLPACNSSEPAPTAAVPPPPPPAAEAPAAVEVAPLPPAFVAEDPGVITASTAFKRSPSDDKKVTDPKTNKPVNNWITTLYRGEKVTLLKQDGDFVQLRASDEQVGWVKSDAVLPAQNVTTATTLEELKTFARPDFSALNTSKTLPPGALLFVTKTKEPFSEVNISGAQKLWVLTDKLSTDTNEVEAARLVGKARLLDEKKDATAAQFWELARSSFGTTQLMRLIDAQQGRAPEAPEVEAPTPSPEQAQQ